MLYNIKREINWPGHVLLAKRRTTVIFGISGEIKSELKSRYAVSTGNCDIALLEWFLFKSQLNALPHHMPHIWALRFLHGVFHKKSSHPCNSKLNPPEALCIHNRQSKQHASLCSDQLLEQRQPWTQDRHDHHTARKHSH